MVVCGHFSSRTYDLDLVPRSYTRRARTAVSPQTGVHLCPRPVGRVMGFLKVPTDSGHFFNSSLLCIAEKRCNMGRRHDPGGDYLTQRSKVRQRRYLKGVLLDTRKPSSFVTLSQAIVLCQYLPTASRGPRCYHPAPTCLSIYHQPLFSTATLSSYGAKTKQPSGRPLFGSRTVEEKLGDGALERVRHLQGRGRLKFGGRTTRHVQQRKLSVKDLTSNPRGKVLVV
ncbi:hypothetical protein BDP81DRAFT_89955 [Colletotrichum phormii]|uniref:Uncharacterized protein n=1 Tax=Colletotrichum phormii TaxID=359342 RepID=A0AAJ0A5A9_9PEZI|nr:uncharacterized protein BDP81DRAFT_89955 [Colletotrichum phormii]KAK1654865.1 hypothetical protein BDP81DRAFT_89955 [Colletotrichum phormii]